MLHRVKNLSPEQKLTVESLLGHTVSEDESVSIKSIGPSEIIPSHLSGEQRNEAVEKLRQYFGRLDAKRAPVSDQEAEEIINEALRSARPNYRPIG
jgi:hypothetical protein